MTKDKFQHIFDEIKESMNLLSYKEGWDDEEACPVSIIAWTYATVFLVNHATKVYENFNVIIETPEIYPCVDGSIDLCWYKEGKYRLLINVDSYRISYYGDEFKPETKIKAILFKHTELDEEVWDWMRCLDKNT